MTTDQTRYQAHWDRMARRFDTAIAPLERRVIGDARDWVCSRAHGRVLELAIGTGLNLSHYPADVELVGVEWSQAMLAEAARKARALDRPVQLVRGDAARLPLEDASFDTVVCTLSLCCIPDDDAALAEAARVLRPGGLLLIADHVVSDRWPLRWLQRAVEAVTVPTQGEHFTRRPSLKVASHGFEVTESLRRTVGVIEMVSAVRIAEPLNQR